MAKDSNKYGEYNKLSNKDWMGGTTAQYEAWRRDKAAMEKGGRTAGRLKTSELRNEKSAKYRVAMAKAAKKVDSNKYGEYNKLSNKDWMGGTTAQYEAWRRDKATAKKNSQAMRKKIR